MLSTDGNSRTVTTGRFGAYRFTNDAAGAIYSISVTAKKYSFAQPTRVLSMTDKLTNVDFTAQE